MRPTRRAFALGLLASAATVRPGWAQGRTIVDSVGRRVAVPDRVARVMAAGPPASILLYALAPEAMVGWVPQLPADAKPFVLPAVRDLPASPRLTGRGGDAPDSERIAALKPDLIVDFGSIGANYVALADKVQTGTRIPYALIDGAIDKSPAVLRLAGDLLGRRERATALAAYAEQTLTKVDSVLAKTTGVRPRVYVARGPEGLLTAVRGSGLTEIVERAGAINVAEGKAERGGALSASLDQIAAWNPDIVIAFDRAAWQAIRTQPGWQKLAAVSGKRAFAAPALPWGWLGEPPSVNRLIGLRWVQSVLYPKEAAMDLRAEAREFDRLFYGVAPGDADLAVVLEGASG
jgi:iron complex transport system substrate-binding protein